MDYILKNKFNVFILILFTITAFIGVIHHEIWRDEAQVWLVVRDLNIFGIIEHVKNEGHPLLWYFLVMPFAKLHLNPFCMQFLSYLFMVVAAGVFLIKSPFNALSKFCVVFSAGFLYWMTVISRNYSLVPLFLFLLAIYYPKQKEHPYIYSVLNILLSNTHILMFGFCSSLCMLFGFENLYKKNKDEQKKFFLPFLAMFVNLGIIVIYLLIRDKDVVGINSLSLAMFHSSYLVPAVNDFLTNLYANLGIVTIIAKICIFLSFVVFFFKNKKMFFVFGTSFIFQFYVYIFVYKTSPEKAYLLFFIILFCFWIILQKEYLSKKMVISINLLIILLFGMSLNLSFVLMRNDFIAKYSGGKEVAEFIEKNISKDAIIISNNPLTTASVLIYLPDRKFYLPFWEDFYTYGFAKKFDAVTQFTFDIPEKFKNREVYFIYSKLLLGNNVGNLDEIEKFVYIPEDYALLGSENFFILKITE